MSKKFKSTLKTTSIYFNGKYSKVYLATMLSLGMVSISYANDKPDVYLSSNFDTIIVAPTEDQIKLGADTARSVDAAYNRGPETVVINPLININTPDANGVSHNKYTQFDINEHEVVFNNRKPGLVVEDFPNHNLVQTGPAAIILNK